MAAAVLNADDVDFSGADREIEMIGTLVDPSAGLLVGQLRESESERDVAGGILVEQHEPERVVDGCNGAVGIDERQLAHTAGPRVAVDERPESADSFPTGDLGDLTVGERERDLFDVGSVHDGGAGESDVAVDAGGVRAGVDLLGGKVPGVQHAALAAVGRRLPPSSWQEADFQARAGPAQTDRIKAHLREVLCAIGEFSKSPPPRRGRVLSVEPARDRDLAPQTTQRIVS